MSRRRRESGEKMTFDDVIPYLVVVRAASDADAQRVFVVVVGRGRRVRRGVVVVVAVIVFIEDGAELRQLERDDVVVRPHPVERGRVAEDLVDVRAHHLHNTIYHVLTTMCC